MPVATVHRSVRRPTPVRGGRTMLEMRREPLYDTLAGDQTTTGIQRLFSVPIGSGGKNILHTNLELPGKLPAPQVFRVEGIELRFNQGLSTLSAGVPANELVANQAAAWHNVKKELISTTFFRFVIGEKAQLEVPTFLIPSNQGIKGHFVFAAPDETEQAAAFANGLRRIMAQTEGMGYSCALRPRYIAPEQPFRCELVFPQALPDANANGFVVTVYLLGTRGVAVQ